ncbi:MAG: hypothetical protein RLN60_02065 [Phycisphaerales bacterium]
MNDHAEHQLHPDQLLAMRVRLLVEEYRAVHQLLMFRLKAMEERLPLTAAGIGGLLVAAGALPKISQVVLLVGLPFAILFWVRSIILHAASKEDAKERIREIELEVAHVCGQPVIRFQSEHPSATGPVGGRTAKQAIYLAIIVGFVALTLCYSLFWILVDDERFLILYNTGLGVCALSIIHALFQFAHRRPSDLEN